MDHKTTSIESAFELLNAAGTLPERIRYCEGTNAKENNVVSKRLFSGSTELWLDLETPTDAIKKAIEDRGYVASANQRVPDGWGTNYDSIYYKLNQPAPSN